MVRLVTRRTASLLPFALAAARTPSLAAEADLVAGAKREGELVWYTTLVVGQIVRPLVQRFEQKYPGIKIQFVPAPWQETTLRLLNENRAGQRKGDIFDGGVTSYPLQDAGYVEKYKVASAVGYPEEFRDPDGYWTANIIQPSTPAVNTDQVPDAEIARTWEDLLHPRWTGRMAWPETPSVSGPPGLIGNILLGMGQDRGMAFLEKLAKQRIAAVPSNQRVVLDQNIGGQYPLVLQIYNYHAAISAAQGAPVQWLKLNPTLVSFGTMGIIKNCPHPYAARLFLEFSMSEEGQRIYADAGYLPAHPNVPTKVPGLLPKDDNYQATIISPGTFIQNDKDWTGIYRRLFT